MATIEPSTPENNGTRSMPIRRSFTVPSKFSSSASSHYRIPETAEIGAADGIETLFVHPDSKVVKFTTSSSGLRPSSSAGTFSPGRDHGSHELLPWTSSLEQTLAVGPLEIYRVPGSVSFLHSNNLLHAILPRTQCWCVDGVSKFVIRVFTDTYYRIELPGELPEDLAKIEAFKDTLRKVLHFERTACPFQRSFTIPLPETPYVPLQRRRTIQGQGPAKKWKLARAHIWRPEDGSEPEEQGESEDSSGSLEGPEDDAVETEDTVVGEPRETPTTPRLTSLKLSSPSPSVRERVAGFTSPRSVASPTRAPHRDASITSRLQVKDHPKTIIQQEAGPSRILQDIPTAMPPSPPDSSVGYESAEAPSSDAHRVARALFDQAQVPIESAPGVDLLPSDYAPSQGESTRPEALEPQELPKTPDRSSIARELDIPETDLDAQEATNSSSTLPPTFPIREVSEPRSDTFPDIATEQAIHPAEPEEPEEPEEPSLPPFLEEDPFAQIQARIKARRSIGHRSISGPTHHRSIATKASISSLAAVGRHPQQQQVFASALVRKAYEVFLGPPAHLAAIMLQIAAQLADGAFAASLAFETPRRGRQHVPGSFDLDDLESSDDEDVALAESESEDVHTDAAASDDVGQPSGPLTG